MKAQAYGFTGIETIDGIILIGQLFMPIVFML